MAQITDKRERLIDAAKHLIHRQGYRDTTLADIARESDVPLGNVYYYFKTKEDIAREVINEHIAAFKAGIAQWDRQPDPRQRLIAFLDYLQSQEQIMADSGCPIGSLCQELNKGDASPLTKKIEDLVMLQIAWATDQYQQMDKVDAEELATGFIATAQGTVLLTNTLKNTDILRRQLKRMKAELTA